MAIRRYGPGKFNTVLESYLYGMEDESIGDAETFGYYALVRIGSDADAKAIIRAAEEDGGALNEDEKELVRTSAGFITEENSQGFVSFEWYSAEDQEEMENSWLEIVDEWDEFQEDEDEQ
jgi:hypothetical protein